MDRRGASLDAGFDHDGRREQDAAVMIPLALSLRLPPTRGYTARGFSLRADTLAIDRTVIRRADTKGRLREAGLAINQAKPSTPY